MNLIVNGKPAVIEGKESITVTEMLSVLKVEQPDFVTVELNGEILEMREVFPTTIIQEGDRVEFLYFMGGGR
jgi:sulfur carrier protein